MRFKRIFHLGKCYDEYLYQQLIKLDIEKFRLGKIEFKNNRTWWVMVGNDKNIIAYCGCCYTSENACLFNRAWVHPLSRGMGIHHRMIDLRIKAAKKMGCDCVITYTDIENTKSANNLSAMGFKLYRPAFMYVGKNINYYKKDII